MLDALQNPIVLAVVVLLLLLLIVLSVLLRRRRAAREEVLPPPELGQSVDYTSLPYEEPQTLGERLRQAPIGVKLLLGLVPLALIIGGVVLYLTFFGGAGQSAEVPTPTPPPPEITNVSARLAGPTRIVVEADTTLPAGTTVTASMKEGDQDLAWFNKETASAQVSSGHVTVVLEKDKNAPMPKSGQQQTITLVATAGGQVVGSEPAKLAVPSIYNGQFYGAPTAAAPVNAVPTKAPAPAPRPTPVPQPSPTPAAEPSPAPALKATVFNGGNIRPRPVVESCPNCPQLHAGEEVTLLGRSEDGKWYRVQAPDGEGWVSGTLLTIEKPVAEQVPVATPAAPTGLTASVFNGGRVRERPVNGKELGMINANEPVQLLEKTSDGRWYRIIDIRNVTGWVSATLLTIEKQVADQVPVAK